MKRIAVYAHYDPRAEVKGYVLHHLRALRAVCDAVWFVSSAALSESEIEKARAVCDRAWTRPNIGFDFGMWKESIAEIDARAWEELLLTNSSVVGPLWPLTDSFARMDRAQCDLWGMTDNVETAWHLQSYFLVFRQQVLKSEAFRRFWETVELLREKQDVIDSYEIGLARFFRDAGFSAGALVPLDSLPARPFFWRVRSPQWRNSTLLQPLALLDRKMPYVKLELLRDNPARTSLRPVYRAIERSGYDLRLIEIDPR